MKQIELSPCAITDPADSTKILFYVDSIKITKYDDSCLIGGFQVAWWPHKDSEMLLSTLQPQESAPWIEK